MWAVKVLISKIITTVHNNLCIIKTDTTKQHLLNNQDNVQPSMICLLSVKFVLQQGTVTDMIYCYKNKCISVTFFIKNKIIFTRYVKTLLSLKWGWLTIPFNGIKISQDWIFSILLDFWFSWTTLSETVFIIRLIEDSSAIGVQIDLLHINCIAVISELFRYFNSGVVSWQNGHVKYLQKTKNVLKLTI